MLTLIREGGFNPQIHLHLFTFQTLKSYRKKDNWFVTLEFCVGGWQRQDYSVSNASVCGAPTLTLTLVKIESTDNLFQTCDPPWL